tara:strand:+ start:71 stop:3139 length:3069 start_codon:yes stop_codon:yes gene_type:complete
MEDACYILKEYINYHDENIKKYGENTVVLMQVGGFYEIYAVINESISIGADIYKLADILGIQVARRNKNIQEISYDNFLMAGWNTFALPKFQKILLNNNYTIILVNQITEPPNPERGITDIISPGTVIDNYNNSDTNHLVSVYINAYPQQFDKKIYVVGLSAIDVSTGQNTIHKIQSSLTDENIWKDELFRLIHYYSPKETIFHIDDEVSLTKAEICNQFVINETTLHLELYTDPQFKKPSFQNEILNKIFKTGYLGATEYLGLDCPEIILSYIYMIQFIHEHKLENLLLLPKPIIKRDGQNLILSHNCIYQLYLTSSKEHESEKYNSLLSILNKCDTAIGRRLCKNRLLYPILDCKILLNRYNMIEKFQKDALYEKIKPNLKKILDIEKLHRKMGLSLLTPYEFYSLHTSYIYLLKIKNILNDVLPEIITENKELLNELDIFMNQYETIFELNELEKYSLTNMSTSVFKRDIYPEIDILQDEITQTTKMIQLICSTLGKYIDHKKEGSIKNDHNEKYGFYLYVTENRAKIFKKRVENLNNKIIKIGEITLDLETVNFVKRGATIHLEFTYLTNLSNSLSSNQLKIQNVNKHYYLDTIKGFYNTKLFNNIVELIGFIDLNTCLAKISIENVYSKPEIIDSDKSQMIAKDIRHPIVELIQTEIEYVPNDVHLSEDGILLFGTNACGKSTLMKSIGLTLIMAQAGFYVPCSQFKYSPYTQIFTRILNNDNIFKRQSSFAVEMSELRGILKRANNKSLVLGDELCSGTETTSALSIVSAGLKTLSDLKCSFIFTSHLHQLMDIQLINDIKSLKIYHLKIEYDSVKDILIYKRKLEKGSGPAIYGLEVCKALDLGTEFISLARKIQLEITNTPDTFINDKISNYNSDIVMDLCQVCQAKSEHTHHIKEQCVANSNGIIDHHHKNITHNLVPLCESCHHKVHNENLRINGYIQTSQGIKLDFKYIDITNSINPKKKFNKKDLETILHYKSDINEKKLKKSNLIKKLELQHHIQISTSTLNKVLNGNY